MDDLAECAAAARDGDPVAIAALVRATQSDVRRLCAHLVDRDSADDLAQETFVRALAALPGFQGRAPVRTWLLSIARRTCADALRARTRRRRLTARLAGLRAPDSALDPADQRTDDGLLSELDVDRRSAFVLTQLLGLSYAEAAAVCDVPVGTIRSRVARARGDLQRSVALRRQA